MKNQRRGALNDVIDKVEFTAKNLTSNVGVFLMAFCDELRAYIKGFMRSGNAYTSIHHKVQQNLE